METATQLKKPAVEAMSEILKERFGSYIKQPRTKQMVGHMVRQIMEYHGYRIEKSNVKVLTGGVFSVATRYVKRGKK